MRPGRDEDKLNVPSRMPSFRAGKYPNAVISSRMYSNRNPEVKPPRLEAALRNTHSWTFRAN